MNEGAHQQLSMVAAKHLNPERMMRVVANAIRTTPKLQECEPMSFLGALMQCAALGLEPNTILGHAYLIPFDNSRKIDGKWVKIPEVQVVIGYKGLIDLARRSGHITSISANIHYDDDELWEYEEGTEATLRHRPGGQEGNKCHAYAIAKFRDGGHAYVVLPWKHIMKIRDGSQGWQTAVRNAKTGKSPWFTHEDAMAMKTAVRALAKYLPLSIEFAEAMTVDEQRGDYRAFALDPTAGVQLDGEAQEVEDEGDATEEGTRSIENARTVTEPAVQQRQEVPVERRQQPRADTGAYVDMSKPKEQVKPEARPEPKQEVQPAAAEREPPLFGMVLRDLREGGLDAVETLHGDAIERLRVENPGQYKALQALMDPIIAEQG
ncbi:recombinase RecT [Cereibacter changlensis]|uniref:recombinase RecT n=1 Tax=Cereibacter changlensis TaxID=402884 RepID=UPI00403468E1